MTDHTDSTLVGTNWSPAPAPAELAPVLPAGADVLDDLTVRELDIVSRQLKCDVYDAVGNDAGGARWSALARLAWLWAKRTDPTAKLDPFLDYTGAQLTQLLRMGADDVDESDDESAAEVDAEANPTGSPAG